VPQPAQLTELAHLVHLAHLCGLYCGIVSECGRIVWRRLLSLAAFSCLWLIVLIPALGQVAYGRAGSVSPVDVGVDVPVPSAV